jgi:hypothetical protein
LKIDQGGLTSPDLVVTQKAEEKQMGKFSKPHGDVQDKLKVSDFVSTTLKIDTWEVRGIYFAMNREPVHFNYFFQEETGGVGALCNGTWVNTSTLMTMSLRTWWG